MSVDKFGRHTNDGKCLRGPRGEGFDLTVNGDFNINNKKLCNVGNATDLNDCVNLKTLQNSIESCHRSFNEVLKPINTVVDQLKENSINPEILQNSIASCRESIKETVKSTNTAIEIIDQLKAGSLLKNDKGEFNANGSIIINLSKPKHWFDAIHFTYFMETISDITYAIYTQLNKKRKKKSKKEWKDLVVRIHPPDWNELFNFRDDPKNVSVEDKPPT